MSNIASVFEPLSRFAIGRNPRHLWRRYLVALLLIVLSIFLANEAPRLSAKGLDASAETISLSARQQMLSQRILFLATRFGAEETGDVRHDLMKSIDEMAHIQDRLAELHQLTMSGSSFSPTADSTNNSDLNIKINSFLSLAQELASSQSDTSSSDLLVQLVSLGGDDLRIALDRAVEENENLMMTRLKRVETVARLFLFLTLVIVVLQAVMFFYPAHKLILRSLDDRDRHAELLSVKNKELEHFTYTASHDLKAPLRSIENLVEWIEADLPLSAKVATEDNFYLLKGRIYRMNALLTDMLAYARLGQDAEPQATHNLPQLIEDVLAWVKVPDKFLVYIDPTLPDLLASRTVLEQIFLNLLSNAVKHHHKSTGIVKIENRSEPGCTIIDVTDDGPGIPPEYRDYIFKAFNRLRPHDQVEGSGIGLSIVKKLVESIDGTISVVGPQGSGTIFRLEFPNFKRAGG